MSDIYVPRDVVFSQVGKPKITKESIFVQTHFQRILEYGPLPRNWEVQMNAQKKSAGGKTICGVRYTETTKQSRPWDHPNSAAGRRERPVILDEFRDEREDKTGAYYPPLPKFRVGDLDFHKHDTWQDALAAALAEDGITAGKANERPSAVHVKNLDAALAQKSLTDPQYELHHELYHPADHDRAVFEGEPQAARVAAAQNRSLAILAPVTMANGRGWNRFWQQRDRPPMQWRWAPGPQCTNRMVVLACFPVYDQAATREAHWFTVSPTPQHKMKWSNHKKASVSILSMRQIHILTTGRIDFAEAHRSFKLPNTISVERAVWIMAAAHRTFINGHMPKNVDLGKWIHQYSGHVGKTSVFKYDHNRPYNGSTCSIRQLGAWLLNGRPSLKYMRLWEEAAEAMLVFANDMTAANKQKAEQRMAAARKLPD
jgi:hypothetical protein